MKDNENKTKNNVALVALAALVIGGGAGFYGGMTYQKSQRSAQFAQFSARGGSASGRAFGRNGGGAVLGDIIASDASSITVKLADGSSKIVLITGSTSINKAAQATAADLKVGERVAVFGATNSDGSVTAQNVQLNPQMRGPNGASGSGRAAGTGMEQQ